MEEEERPIVLAADWPASVFLTASSTGRTAYRFVEDLGLPASALSLLLDLNAALQKPQDETTSDKMRRTRMAIVAGRASISRHHTPRSAQPLLASWSFHTLVAAVGHALNDESHAVIDGFLPHADGLHEWLRSLHSKGQLRPGAVTTSGRVAARGDLMTWIDVEGPSCASSLYSMLDKLVHELCTTFGGTLDGQARCQLQRTEIQATCYPKDARGYVRHVDNPRGDRERVITAILYLNPTWTAGDGGELRVYTGFDDWQGTVIEPLHNRLVRD